MWIFGRQPVRAAKANTFAVKALEQDCDPKPLLDLLNQHGWWRDFRKIGPLIAINGLEAMLAAGMGDAALPAIRAILTDAPPQDPGAQCAFRILESLACVQLERWPEAVRAQNQAMELFQGPVAGTQRNNTLQWLLCYNGYQLQLHQGMAQALEAPCRQLLESVLSPRWEVETHLLLGRLYLALDRPEEAEEHLDRAVAQGNNLYARTQAQLLLCRQRGETPSGALLAAEALRKLRLLLPVWNQECRFTPALDLCLEALDQPGVAEQAQAAQIRELAAGALVNLGRYQEALDQLDLIRLSSQQERQPHLRLDLLCRRSAALSGLGRTEEAGRFHAQAMELFQAGGQGVEQFRSALTRNACALQLQMGLLEGVEDRVRQLLDQAENTLERVLGHMLLAQYHLALQRPEEARPHLEFVAQHGGQHHARAEAQALLG